MTNRVGMDDEECYRISWKSMLAILFTCEQPELSQGACLNDAFHDDLCVGRKGEFQLWFQTWSDLTYFLEELRASCAQAPSIIVTRRQALWLEISRWRVPLLPPLLATFCSNKGLSPLFGPTGAQQLFRMPSLIIFCGTLAVVLMEFQDTRRTTRFDHLWGWLSFVCGGLVFFLFGGLFRFYFGFGRFRSRWGGLKLPCRGVCSLEKGMIVFPHFWEGSPNPPLGLSVGGVVFLFCCALFWKLGVQGDHHLTWPNLIMGFALCPTWCVLANLLLVSIAASA